MRCDDESRFEQKRDLKSRSTQSVTLSHLPWFRLIQLLWLPPPTCLPDALRGGLIDFGCVNVEHDLTAARIRVPNRHGRSVCLVDGLAT